MTPQPQLARIWLAVAAISGAAAVGLGAFGSHGLRHVVSPEQLAVWRTAVEYQFFHTLLLLVLTFADKDGLFRWAMRLVAAGIVLFSGSLYALVLTGTRSLGVITPLGGLCFIAGWLSLAWAARKQRGADFK
jgi:uncharacterized membrane protein YgdD (TMEM256/DUF423 family)